MKAGSTTSRLIVLRGNSGSGKSSVAAGIRERYGRGLAVVGQDNLRRIVLRERDVPGGADIGLIDTVARHALDHGYHVVVEGMELRLSRALTAALDTAHAVPAPSRGRRHHLDHPGPAHLLPRAARRQALAGAAAGRHA